MLKSIIAGGTGVGSAAYMAMKDKPRNSDDQGGWSTEQALNATALGVAAFATTWLVGTGAIKGAKGLWNNKKAVGEAAVNTMETAAGAAAYTGAGFARGVISPIGGAIKAVGDNFFKRSADSMVGFELNGKGKLAMGVIGIGAGIKGGWDKYKESRTGQLVGASTSTPEETLYNAREDMARMADMMGANGDLVFALNKNRRG